MPYSPAQILRYFVASALLLTAGIALAILQTAVIHPDTGPLDTAALQTRADYHSSMVAPFLASVFPKLLFLNAGVALFILVVPLLWVWIWWFRRDFPDQIAILMKGTVAVLMVALGHNSFTKIYDTFRLLPLPVTAVMYLPHGIPEMLAFVLAGTSAFILVDELRAFLQENGDARALHPGDICLFILGRAWMAGLVIFVLMAFAAAIECWVTPVLVESAFAAALQGG
jgi:hypothetical protein